MATKAGGAYIEIRGEHKKLQGDLDAAHSKVATATKKIERTLNRALKIGRAIALAGITAGTVALTRKVISLGREFEFNMKTVQAWSGATGKELQKLTDIARKMGATTEHTATQAAGALKFLAAAGFTVKQSISALPGTLDLATAGQVDLASATDITTDVLTAFGMQVSELERVSDAFITTSSSSNTNVLMLGSSMKFVASTAHLFGLTVEQTAAMLGTLANSGIKAEMAGSGLNMVLMKSARAAKMLGLDAMTPLIDVLKKMKEEQWDAIKIGRAFGVRQVKTVAILMNNIDMYEKLTKKIIENKGATSKLASIMRDSLDVDIKTLSSTIEEELLRVFDKYKDDIRETIQLTTEWIHQNPQAIEQVAELTKNMVDIAIAMGKTITLGGEYANVWIKTWQAMGLASTGVITWSTALTDGVNAVDLFNKELSIEAMRLFELEKIMARTKDWAGVYTQKAYQTAKKEAEILREIIASRETLAAIKAPGRLEKALADPSKYYGAVSTEAAPTGVAPTGAAPTIPIADMEEYNKLLKEKALVGEEYWNLLEEMWGREKRNMIERRELEKETLESWRTATMTETELALDALDKQFSAYDEFVKDKAALDEWHAAQYNEITKRTEEVSSDLYDDMENAMMGWASGFSGTLNDMLWGAEVTFKSIFESFAKMITQMLIQKHLIDNMFSGGGGGGGWFGAALGFLGSLGGGASGNGTGPITNVAQGGIFPSGINAYSNQIVDRPTQFAFARGSGLMGEAGPEAVMPLTRTPSGDLGVKTEGTGAPTIIIVANDAKSFADMVNRNPEAITIVVGDALREHGDLLNTVRETI